MPVSLQDVPLSIAQSLWLDTESQYRDAVAAMSSIESDEQLRSQAGGKDHPDFSEEKPIVHIEPRRQLELEDLGRRLTPIVREVSRVLGDDPQVLDSQVAVVVTVQNHAFVSSEGTRVQSGRVLLRMGLQASAKAEDGMEVQRSQQFDAHRPEQLPTREVLLATAERLRAEVVALKRAAVAEPYTGPAVLEGEAAGVFFHEIFGHRLEGHRQKDDSEGQTFTGMIDKRVLPTFLDVVDDPTLDMLGTTPLSGHYLVDDEGVKGQPTVLVEKGRLRTFLLGRSPVLPFLRSNGHGRREAGYPVVARQGNLIVSSRKTLSERALRRALLDEVRRQDKPYGLWFSAIDGGYTTTDRGGPQAFKVLPRLVRRVYADGRPDELVRGVDIVGTPLQAFETIVATGDRPGIFNGTCGAESGWVPVSAVSPSLLLRTLEVERTVHDRDRPPLLGPPESEAEP
jgi:predicted Zn-dependent protease